MDINEEWLLREIEKAQYLVVEIDGFKDPVDRLKKDSKVRSVFGRKRKIARSIEAQPDFLSLFPKEEQLLEALIQNAKAH